jgi:hypothetical protein
VLYFLVDIPIGGDKMSFEDFNKAELKKLADEFVLDVEDDASEEDLRAAVQGLKAEEVALSFPEWSDRLVEEEDDEDEESALVTSEATPKKAAKKAPAKKAAVKKTAAKKAETVVEDDNYLIKMTRNNPVYEIRGYRFTRAMPYVYVKAADVDFLIEVEGGFQMAKPSEVEAFFN